MRIFSEDEKAFLHGAINTYFQLVQQQMPAAEVEKIYQLAKEVLEKVETADTAGARTDEKPKGISEEWFEKCCKRCEMLAPGGKCMNKITDKFPGKCDPILLYERQKSQAKTAPPKE